jgi:hypothetical protein
LDITCARIAGGLVALGVHETKPNTRDKAARGGFTAVFLVQVMAAIGAKEVRLD